MTHVVPRLGAALILAFLTVSGAFAQVGGAPGTTNGTLTGPVVGAAPGRTSKPAPPPALPGARASDAEPAPADRLASDMHPNDALFDAVNRGDIVSARDAIGRGADLNARNVLGLSPVDLSVDLGRNDITFLLLSLRGPGGGGALPLQAPTQPVSPQPAASVRTTARTDAPRVPSRPSVPVLLQRYAEFPDTPVPDAGFLGFGGAAR